MRADTRRNIEARNSDKVALLVKRNKQRPFQAGQLCKGTNRHFRKVCRGTHICAAATEKDRHKRPVTGAERSRHAELLSPSAPIASARHIPFFNAGVASRKQPISKLVHPKAQIRNERLCIRFRQNHAPTWLHTIPFFFFFFFALALQRYLYRSVP